MTKSIVAIIVCCLSVFVMEGPSHENQPLVLNGTNWKAFSNAEKLMYVTGFVRGYVLGGVDGMGVNAKLMQAMLSKTHCDCTPSLQTLTKEETLKVIQNEASDRKLPFIGDFQTTSLQQFVNTMAVFYGDFRNMPVCWDNALRFSAGSLEGRAATEQELDAARKADAASGCK